MKKLLIIFCAVLFSYGAFAQTTDDIQLIQSMWGKEKRAIVADYMGLTTQDEAAFWTAYDAYEADRKELGKVRIDILNEYAENFGALSDDKATDLVNRGISNNIAIQKLSEKTFKKMIKAVGPFKAAKFIQLENYFQVAIQMDIQESIPFIGELGGLRIER